MRQLRPGRVVLTRHERRLLDLTAQGLTIEEIAARLHISRGTAKLHRQTVLAKLGAKNASQAVAIAVRDGHID